MSLYNEQIEKRREREQADYLEALDEATERLNLRGRRHTVPQTDNNALKHLFGALGVTDYELVEDDMRTPIEQLEDILRPRGIMMRHIQLKGRWWRETVGPILGYDKNGGLVALLPSRWGFSYWYHDKEGRLVKVGRHSMEKELDTKAICFCTPLPLRKLGIRDLVAYGAKAMAWHNAFLVVLACLVVMLFAMFTPFVNNLIFDMVIPAGQLSDLWPIAGLLIGSAIGMALFTLTRNFVILRVKGNFELNVQNALMARTFLLPPKFFLSHSSGELNTRISSIGVLCTFISEEVLGVLLSTVFNIGYLIQVFIYAKQLLGTSLLVITLQVLLLVAHYYITMNNQQAYLTKRSELDGLEYNLFAGIQKIKLTGSERRAFTRWLRHYSDTSRLIYNKPKALILLPALMQMVSVCGTMLIFWLTIRNGVGMANYIAFAAAFGVLGESVASLGNLIPQIAQTGPLMRQVEPFLHEVPEVNDQSGLVTSLSGSIEISDLSFRYDADGPWIIRHLNLNIQPGEYVGVVGKSGCGKSTLLRLLLGFEKPSAGAILYDTYDLQKVDKPSLRRRIGCCLQNGSLFNGDLFHNITITAPWSTHDDAWEALRMASLDQDVKAMPMGLHTLVSEGGGGFSGGQKQRLLIARALINKPDIVFFDEATSALDNISQQQVSDNMDSLNCTRVIIAHRLSTIRNCDRIIVLDHGQIVEQGSFDELMALKGQFYEMSLRQM